MTHDNNPPTPPRMAEGRSVPRPPVFKELSEGRTETLTVSIVQGGSPGAYGDDLSDIPNGPFSCSSDLQWRLGLCVPLRDWLEAHGAFTPGAKVWVRVVSDREDPAEVAADGPIEGRVVDACRITTTVRTCPVGGG